jgi:hypothetical protein
VCSKPTEQQLNGKGKAVQRHRSRDVFVKKSSPHAPTPWLSFTVTSLAHLNGHAHVRGNILSTTSSPSGLEDSQEPCTPQDADAEGRHNLGVGEHGLDDAADDHETVESVEQRHEITLEAKTVNLQHHFDREKADEKQVGYL